MHKASWGRYIFVCQEYDSHLYFYVPFHIIALHRIKNVLVVSTYAYISVLTD